MERNRVVRLGSVLFALAALSGCGMSPASAPPNTAITNPTFVRIVQPPATAGREAGRTSALSPLAASMVIDGSVGGVIELSVFRLQVPAGAFVGPATISINMADPTIYQCDLTIDPPAANHFLVPVVLTATLPTRTDAMIDHFLWHDVDADVWRVIPTVRDVNTVTVASPLSHFSAYGVVEGKAGW